MLNIDYILRGKRISKTELARRANISRQALHSILTGNPTLSSLELIASALEITLAELFQDTKKL